MALHVMEEANRCLGCKNPRCREGCPIHTNIPEVIRLLKAGNDISFPVDHRSFSFLLAADFEALSVPFRGFRHLNTGEAGGDHAAVNDQKNAAAYRADANAGVESFLHIVHDELLPFNDYYSGN